MTRRASVKLTGANESEALTVFAADPKRIMAINASTLPASVTAQNLPPRRKSEPDVENMADRRSRGDQHEQ